MMIPLLLTTGYHIGEKKLSLENTGRPSVQLRAAHTHTPAVSEALCLAKETSEDQRLSKGRYEEVLSVQIQFIYIPCFVLSKKEKVRFQICLLF